MAYRLSSRRYPANSSEGAKIYGGRWNPPGAGVVYAASNPSLCALEVLTQYSELPNDYAFTEIQIPDEVRVEVVLAKNLPAGWQEEVPINVEKNSSSAAQRFGQLWFNTRRSTILSVPSAVMGVGYPTERVLVINPTLAAFNSITFRPPTPFRFDPRLKR